ncbi:MAG: hypothetical protein AAGF24_15010 [Cyanobacteria bacterium P01_H01_bin.121]
MMRPFRTQSLRRARAQRQPRSIFQFAADAILLLIVIHQLTACHLQSVEPADTTTSLVPTYLELLHELYVEPK